MHHKASVTVCAFLYTTPFDTYLLHHECIYFKTYADVFANDTVFDIG